MSGLSYNYLKFGERKGMVREYQAKCWFIIPLIYFDSKSFEKYSASEYAILKCMLSFKKVKTSKKIVLF